MLHIATSHAVACSKRTLNVLLRRVYVLVVLSTCRQVYSTALIALSSCLEGEERMRCVHMSPSRDFPGCLFSWKARYS